MSFLSDIGKKCFAGLRFAAPLLGGLSSGYVPDPFHTISGLVLAAEALGEHVQQAGGSKVDKLACVVEGAQEVLLASPLFRGKSVTDQNNFKAGVSQLVQGIVQVLESVEDHPRIAPPAAAPAPAPTPAG